MQSPEGREDLIIFSSTNLQTIRYFQKNTFRNNRRKNLN